MSENIRPIDMAIEILQETNDGNKLAPHHLKLLESAVNGFLTEAGEVAFYELYSSVKKGYKKPWFHGIEHLTIDHQGYVYWKEKKVEHYNPGWRYSEEAKKAAKELAQRCTLLESQGKEINTSSVIWNWND